MDTVLYPYEISDRDPSLKKLWPREMVYLYVINQGETTQDFYIAYSKAVSTLVMTMGTTIFSTLSLLFISST